jgi:hypothetical protein
MRIVQRLLTASALAFAPLAAAPGSAATILSTDITAASPIARVSVAATENIIGGGTQVTLTAADVLTGLGLTFTPYGTASVVPAPGDPIVNFLITGGTRDNDTGDLLVRHDGSGLDFAGGGSTLRIGDFLIDTAAGLVSGSAVANGSALGVVPLFTLGDDLELLLTSQAAGAFTSVFGAPDLTGAEIGTALVVPVFAAIPEPAAWALMIGGFMVVGMTARKQRTRTVLA